MRAAYEIFLAFLAQTAPEAAREGAPEEASEEEVPIPEDLRVVIDQIVAEFRQHQRWAEAETLAQLAAFEAHMTKYIQTASRAELRQFSSVFRTSWDAILNALFEKCNNKKRPDPAAVRKLVHGEHPGGLRRYVS